VKKKPYLESKDSEGRPDEIVAAEAWSMHKQREDSIVVDTFHGQLKSHVTCKNCQKVSVKFDAFSSLSLPLPVKNEKPVNSKYIFICFPSSREFIDVFLR
jgi:ubiquitin carboxyl-terminal hydrolase 4/11/15